MGTLTHCVMGVSWYLFHGRQLAKCINNLKLLYTLGCRNSSKNNLSWGKITKMHKII